VRAGSRSAHWVALLVALLIALAAGEAAARIGGGQTSSASGTSTDITLNYDGVDRTYRLHVPPASGGAAVPLLVALHGASGDGPEMEADTGLSQSADRLRFAVAYPTGIDNRWSDGRPTTGDVDDVGFLDAVVADARRRIAVSRVFATGMSNGGGMTIRLACERADRYDGFAIVAASISTDVQPSCQPPTRPNILVINGDADPILPFNGGTMKKWGNYGGGQVVSAYAMMNYWAQEAGCPPSWTSSTIDEVPWDGTKVTDRRARACNGAPVNVELLQIVNGGHTWPGAVSSPPAWIVGRTSYEFSASDYIMQFLGASS